MLFHHDLSFLSSYQMLCHRTDQCFFLNENSIVAWKLGTTYQSCVSSVRFWSFHRGFVEDSSVLGLMSCCWFTVSWCFRAPHSLEMLGKQKSSDKLIPKVVQNVFILAQGNSFCCALEDKFWCYLLQPQGFNIVLAQNSARSSLKFLTKQVYQSL